MKKCETCVSYRWIGLSFCTKLLPPGHPDYPTPMMPAFGNPPEWCPGHEEKETEWKTKRTLGDKYPELSDLKTKLEGT